MSTNLGTIINMTGDQFAADLKSEIRTLVDELDERAPVWLTGVSGGNTISASGARLVASYSPGQLYLFVAAEANTGPVTLQIDAQPAKPIRLPSGGDLAPGAIIPQMLCAVVYNSAADAFHLANPPVTRAAPRWRVYENLGVSGQITNAGYTWYKPAGLLAVKVTVIGGGCGGADTWGAGEAGGAAVSMVDASSLPAAVGLTVGRGGYASSGGTSNFGSFAEASGGTGTGTSTTPGKGTVGDIKISGAGGTPIFGGRMTTQTRMTNGGDGNYGAGGAVPNATTASEANSGVVIVEEYF